MPGNPVCSVCGEDASVVGTTGPDGFCASCRELRGGDIDREPPGGVSGEPGSDGALSSEDTVGGEIGDASSLDETVTESDTVAGMDTDAPDLEDEAAESWREGGLVANRFRLLRFIGQGGMGKVYLAQDETLKRPNALKRIPQEIIFDVDARDDLRLEANRLLDLAHENIVRVHTYYDGPTWPFFAMEYLQGPTLKKLLRERKREGRVFSPEEVMHVAGQVGCGLEHAHAHKIIHRDLKPANLMLVGVTTGDVTDSDTVKITDFGISRVAADSTLRQTGRRSGTLPYMSPEQYRGEACTEQSDIYSLACTLYELLCGTPPFTTGDIGYQILNVEPKPLEDVPRPLATAVERALSKRPEDRFETVGGFVAAIDGRVRVPPRRAFGGFGSVASKMVAGLIFAGLVLFLAWSAYSGTDEPSYGGSSSRESLGDSSKLLPADAAATPAERRKKLDDFSGWLKQALDADLPTVIGRRHATRVSPTGRPHIDVDLRFVEQDAPMGAALLSRVIFIVGPVDSDGLLVQHQVPGQSENGVHTFTFMGLGEGAHVLKAVLSTSGSILSEKQELFRRDLIVDLTPPVFDVRALHSDVLVEAAGEVGEFLTGRQVFATFEESVDVRLATGDVGDVSDIEVAYYQIVTPDSTSAPIEIEDPQSWRVPRLAPGERKTLRVFATDRVGHRSGEHDVVFHRYKMDLEEFRTVEVIGNVATLQGVFRYQGDSYPDLVFFVNGEEVEAGWRILSGESRTASDGLFPSTPDPSSDIGSGVMTGLAFEARVTLLRPANTVEVQYSWKERRAGSFPKGGFLDSVRMRAPGIEFAIAGARPVDEDPVPGERPRTAVVYTKKSQVAIEGTIEPYFSGLQLLLVAQNDFGSLQRTVVVDPAATGTSGKFEIDVEVEPGVENLITIESYYRGEAEELLPAPDALTVWCDQDPPTASVTLQVAGEQLVVRIQADEAVELLRGRLVPMGGSSSTGGMTPWQDIPAGTTLQPEQPTFTWRVPVPQDSMMVHVELTDRAGNVSTLKEFFNLSSPTPARAPADGPRTRKSSPAPEPGTIILRSPFLHEISMRFRVCGPSRLEMASTEVSEYAWFLFLEEKGRREVQLGRGRREHPMVLVEDHYLKLLPEFVRWFEVNAADGYSYAIPRQEDWLRAFTGAGSVDEARTEISDWFGDLRSGFGFRQSERYGQNKPSEIGARPSNLTPTELLDMESNLQEIVLDSNDFYAVIGGHNQLGDAEHMERHCLASRRFDTDTRELLGRFTGLRLCRRPKTGD